MFGYYITLALRSLRRNPLLTALMIIAIGVGIGASMTTLTVFRAMAADPIADRSSQLFVPQVDNWGPSKGRFDPLAHPDHLNSQLSYLDAMALMRAHAAERQTALYKMAFAVRPQDPRLLPFRAGGRAAYADFFQMFEVPFRYGSAWSTADDEQHASVAVISSALNDKLFGGADSVGRILHLDNEDLRIVGVLARWNPEPRYYDLLDKFGSWADDVFLPFTTAIDLHEPPQESRSCAEVPQPGWTGLLQSDCVWIELWVQLPTAAAAARYRAFLIDYAAEQQRIGRFHWAPHVQLRDLRAWLIYQHVVSGEARILVLVSFSFLFICLLNAMGLMLARNGRRAADIGVRRALGANRSAVFVQCLIEAAVIGAAGAALGLALTALGLAGLRSALSGDIQVLAHLNVTDVAITIGVAGAATLLAGLYPTWRAARVQPAWQLKAQ